MLSISSATFLIRIIHLTLVFFFFLHFNSILHFFLSNHNQRFFLQLHQLLYQKYMSVDNNFLHFILFKSWTSDQFSMILSINEPHILYLIFLILFFSKKWVPLTGKWLSHFFNTHLNYLFTVDATVLFIMLMLIIIIKCNKIYANS